MRKTASPAANRLTRRMSRHASRQCDASNFQVFDTQAQSIETSKPED
jgi:hypothetical protein